MKLRFFFSLLFLTQTLLAEDCYNNFEVLDPHSTAVIEEANKRISFSSRNPSSTAKAKGGGIHTRQLSRQKNGKSRFPQSVNIHNKLKTANTSDQKSSYQEIYDMTRKLSRSNPRQCMHELFNFYKTKSQWKDLGRKERLHKIYQLSNEAYREIVAQAGVQKCQQLVEEYYDDEVSKEIGLFLVTNFQHNTHVELPEGNKSPNRTKALEIIDAFLDMSKNEDLLQKIPITSEFFIPNLPDNDFDISLPLRLPTSYRLYLKWSQEIEDTSSENLLRFLGQEVGDVLAPFFVSSYSTWMKKSLALMVKGKDFTKEELALCTPLFKILEEFENQETSERLTREKSAILLGLKEKIKDFNFRIRPENPYQIHKLLSPHLIRCVIYQETRTTLDLHTMNYTACQRRFMTSTAQGLGQTTFSTFRFLQQIGALPLVEEKNLTEEDVEYLFEQLNEHADWQIKTIFYHFNYLLKVKNDDTYASSIVAYDLDNRSAYLKNVTRCLDCLKKYPYDDYSIAEECHR